MSRKPTVTKSSSKEKEPRPPATFHQTTVLADTITMFGIHNLHVGAATVIHTRTNILTYSSPVHIGTNCLISDLCTIGICTPTFSPKNKRASHAVRIGNYVTIEPGCIVEGCVGTGSVLEAGAKVGRGAMVGNWCRISAHGVVGEGECVEEGEVVLGSGLGRRKEGINTVGREVRAMIGEKRRKCEAELLVKSGRVVNITDGETD
jgi:dynactin-6